MRIINSVKNVFGGIFSQIITVALGLVSQSIFIRQLGIEYAGITGTFNSVISMLSLAELGVGSAMIYALYEPLAFKKVEKVKSLMLLYKKAYEYIGIIIAFCGILISPFIKHFFKDITIDVNLYVVFFLFLFNAVFSYFYTYKRSILYADQNDYINKAITISSVIVLNCLQIFSVIYFKSYYVYLISRVLVMMAENFIVSFIANKKYPFLLEKDIQPLSLTEKRKIISNIKALCCHKIGGFIVLGTDSMIVSSLINVASAGIFGTYMMISRYLMGFGSAIISATTASFGNLLVTDHEKAYNVFGKLYYLNFFVASVSSACLLNCVHPFMQAFAGIGNTFGRNIEIVLVLEFYVHSLRASIGVGKDAAGIYRPDRFVPLWEAFVNLTTSILLVEIWGVVGVIVGTIVSTLLSVFISVPYLTFRYVYSQPLIKYYKTYVSYFIIATLCCYVSYLACGLKAMQNPLLEFIKNGCVSMVISMLLIFILTYRKNEFQYYWQLIKSALVINVKVLKK